MKRILVIISLGLLSPKITSGQCIKNISTNPDNPWNQEFLDLMNSWYPTNGPYSDNSFLNSFDWRWPLNIKIDLSQSWSHPLSNFSGIYPMANPFDNIMGGDYDYLQKPADPLFRDYHWKDGWELLWMNLGAYPNGDLFGSPGVNTYFGKNNILSAPTPSNIPYFILYNRYRGMMRVFANVWFDNLNARFQDIVLTIKFTESSDIENQLSGVLRHASGLDRSLDQKTEIRKISSPRIHPVAFPKNQTV